MRGERDILGHPRGLLVLAGTELWERISFQGMQALLVLYMVEKLLLPGSIEHVAGLTRLRGLIESVTGSLSPQPLASQIFGLYVGFIYFAQIVGGLLGDRVLGHRQTVILGAILMTSGHFCMVFEQSFLFALLLLILGAGCMRGNLASQVGNLYSKEDNRRAVAFQIYIVVINCGAFAAPLITGLLAQSYGWQYGFGFAGIGMLAGLAIYIAGQRDIPLDESREVSVERARLDDADRRVVIFLILLLPLLTLFWIAQAQVWNTYNVWARDHVDLFIRGWQMPVPWLQSVDAFFAVVMVPPVLLLWRWQYRGSNLRDDFHKLGIGCLIFGAGMAWLSAAGMTANMAGKIPLPWVLVFHFISNIGFIYFAPTGMGMFSRAAPAAVNAIMMSVYSLSIFSGAVISGRLGGLYEQLTPAGFWLLHAAIVGTGGLLILLFAPRLRYELTRRESGDGNMRVGMHAL